MRELPVCADCGCQSPKTDTNYTLISKRHGWRLTRSTAPDGSFVVEWRCPTCSTRHRSSSASSKPPATFGPNLFFRHAMQLLAGDIAPPSER